MELEHVHLRPARHGYMTQTRAVWDCHRTAEKRAGVVDWGSMYAYMAVLWSVWVI